MHNSKLKIGFRGKINGFVALVKLFTSFDKVALHQIQKFVIFGSIDSRIFDDHQTVFSENLGDLFAAISVVRSFVEEVRNVNAGHFDILNAVPNDFG